MLATLERALFEPKMFVKMNRDGKKKMLTLSVPSCPIGHKEFNEQAIQYIASKLFYIGISLKIN